MANALVYTVERFGSTVQNGLRNDVNQLKYIVVETDATVDATDTIPVTLSKFGATTFLGIKGFCHTTDNSVIETENSTTTVASGVVTITVEAGSDDDKRVYKLWVK